MDTTYLSLFSFLLITWMYYYTETFGKLPLELPDEKNATSKTHGELGLEGQYDTYSDYTSANIGKVAIYFLLIVLTQFGLNIYSVVDKCGGSAGKNLMASFFMTVLPWSIIFGGVIGMLIVYPGLKCAFADVVGFFLIVSEANEILSTIIIDKAIDAEIEKVDNKDESNKLKRSAEAIMKMNGNSSILVNAMNPGNFSTMWATLKPLMVKESELPAGQFEKSKRDLFKLVVKKDNIGEGMWYIYTAMLLVSIVSYNLSTSKCSKDAAKTQEDHDAYLETVNNLDKKKAANQSGEPYST